MYVCVQNTEKRNNLFFWKTIWEIIICYHIQPNNFLLKEICFQSEITVVYFSLECQELVSGSQENIEMIHNILVHCILDVHIFPFQKQ